MCCNMYCSWLQPSYKGKYLLEHVCQQLNLTETDYFGLRYVDAGGQRVNNYSSKFTTVTFLFDINVMQKLKWDRINIPLHVSKSILFLALATYGKVDIEASQR